MKVVILVKIDYVLCNTSPTNHNLNLYEPETLSISNFGIFYSHWKATCNEIMMLWHTKMVIPINAIKNLYIPYGIPFDLKLVYKE